jgi:hypothetical protein
MQTSTTPDNISADTTSVTPISPNILHFTFEYTDTFGGEANYAWVRRVHRYLNADISDAKLKREAKRVMNMSGVRGRWESHSDEVLAFYPSGIAAVLFVTYE